MDYFYSKSKNYKQIDFFNPNLQYHLLKKKIDCAIQNVLSSKNYIKGNELTRFEKNYSKFIGVKYSVGVASGTDAIELSLRSLDIGKSDEVITVSHTAFPTISAIISTGATPVLVDIDDTYTINVNKISKAISSKTKAIIAVHLYGNACQIDELQKICKINNIYLIEDASQAHGGKWKNKKLGSFGDTGCFSFYPTKNLGAIGDGGIITTNKKYIYEKLMKIREYGWDKKRKSLIFGKNSRLDEIQAAILNVKLKFLNKNNNKRGIIAKYYTSKLINTKISTPRITNNAKHVFHLYVIQVNERNKLIKYLKKNNIKVGIHYELPCHLHPSIKNKIRIPEKLKYTEKYSKKILSLPIYPELKIKDLRFIVSTLIKFEKKK